MSTSTKILVNSTNSSIESLYKTSKTNSAYESGTNFNNVLNSKNTLNSKTNSQQVNDKETDKYNKSDTTNVEDQDANRVDELQDKLKELDDESKSKDSKDKTNEILNELMNLLAKLGLNKTDITNGKIDSEALNKLLEGSNGGNGSSNVMNKLMELLQTKSVTDKLDSGSLKSIKNILENLSQNNSSAINGMKDLISETANVINNRENQNGKMLTLEEMLNRSSSQDSNENSNKDNSNDSNSLLNNKETSKEDKFLNSLTKDNNDPSLDKINLFASRAQVIQNQGTINSSENININKSTFVSDLIKDVKYMSNNGIKELTVKINPGNIGEITISLTEENGVMKANLKANSKDAANLLMQNLSDIKNQLNDKNIKIDDVNIELYQEDTTFFSNQGFNSQLNEDQQKNSNNGKPSNEEISVDSSLTDDTQDTIEGNLNYLA